MAADHTISPFTSVIISDHFETVSMFEDKPVISSFSPIDLSGGGGGNGGGGSTRPATGMLYPRGH